MKGDRWRALLSCVKRHRGRQSKRTPLPFVTRLGKNVQPGLRFQIGIVEDGPNAHFGICFSGILEDKIERHLSRYIKSKNHKRFQGIIQVKPVRDNVSPTELYDYLESPITNPDKNNLINYIANNRHLPSIQYPLTTIYSTKKL